MRHLILAATLVASAGVAGAQSTRKIITQPARDVGIDKNKVPPLLAKAAEEPYSIVDTDSCARIAAGISELTSVVGPDFSDSPAENKANYAKIGGAAVVNSLIPFRGIVRAVSGASAAEQRMKAAIDAGVARRGFLRGLQSAKGCGR